MGMRIEPLLSKQTKDLNHNSICVYVYIYTHTYICTLFVCAFRGPTKWL